jgi:hypothetical protein
VALASFNKDPMEASFTVSGEGTLKPLSLVADPKWVLPLRNVFSPKVEILLIHLSIWCSLKFLSQSFVIQGYHSFLLLKLPRINGRLGAVRVCLLDLLDEPSWTGDFWVHYCPPTV